MPYEDGTGQSDELCSQLAIIDNVISQNPDYHILVGGDFNVDFSRERFHTELLLHFCNNMNLKPASRHPAYKVDYKPYI
jgi:hypothetical protein